jgi:hypothetical protein
MRSIFVSAMALFLLLQMDAPENLSSTSGESIVSGTQVPLTIPVAGLEKMKEDEFSRRIVDHTISYAMPSGVPSLGTFVFSHGGVMQSFGYGQESGRYRFENGNVCYLLERRDQEVCLEMYVARNGDVYVMNNQQRGTMARKMIVIK